MILFSVSYSELCHELIDYGSNVNLLTNFIKQKNSVLTIDEIEIVEKAVQKRFFGHFLNRWRESHKIKSYFFRKNATWLESKYIHL